MTDPTIAEIQMAVALWFGLPLGALRARHRNRRVVRPRHVAIYMARVLTGHSLPFIGRQFQRDHTTVLYATRNIAELRARDMHLDFAIRRMTDCLIGQTRPTII